MTSLLRAGAMLADADLTFCRRLRQWQESRGILRAYARADLATAIEAVKAARGAFAQLRREMRINGELE